MRRFPNPLAFVLAAILCTVPASQLTGCAGRVVEENNPQSLYEDAEAEIKADRYQIASERLRMIRARFPHSKFGALAQLRLADVYFMQESFGEAAVAYETFRDLHPKHEKIQYALFRIGESYQGDVPSTTARDMGSAVRAVDSYEDYLRRFPAGEFAQKARESANLLRNQLAEKEVSIAEFYLRNDKPSSAKFRLEKAVKDFPGTPAAEKATERLKNLPPTEEAKSGS
jgi:outer membrane protein assembly factor BamD